MSDPDAAYMKQALSLARKGLSTTHPNPMVGAIIVKNGRVIGKGWHKQAGGPHAEIEALLAATESVEGSTMYVSLEPHGFIGKTLPCTEAIIAAGIERIVCATLDPNPRVKGDGIAQLQTAGIDVSCGLMETKARELNEQFFVFHEKQRPFIAVKFAASLDGKLATASGDSKWITNQAARDYGRKLRGRYHAILVGIHTVLADDPHLGSRTLSQPDSLRIILDSELRIPLDAQVLRDQHVLIATTSRAPSIKKDQLLAQGFRVVTFKSPRIALDELMTKLREMNIVSVLVEGGGEIIGDFVDKKLVDRIYAFYSPILIGGKAAVSLGGSGATKVSDALSMGDPKIKKFGNNLLIEGPVV